MPSAFTNPASTEDPRKPWVRPFVRGLVVLGLVGLLVGWIGSDVQGWLRQALEFIEGLGVWGPVLFVAVYVLATVFLLPGSILTLGAGAVFGVVRGSIYVSIAATLGAGCAFLVGRYLARDWIAKRLQGNERLAAIDRAVAEEGWLIVGLTRLSPVFPFTLLNYAYGLTRVSFRDYFLASWIGMMPGTVMYVSLGAVARVSTGGTTRTTAEWVLFGVGIVATVAVTVIITRMARRALGKRLGTPTGS